MIERFRYLPCALHPALAVPTWAKIKNGDLYDGSPYSIAGPRFFIDLAHPAGWDHAVRALVVISGGPELESTSAHFYLGKAFTGRMFSLPQHPAVDARLTWAYDSVVPAEQRREALCRCICAALNLDPNDVFPVSTS